MDATGLDKAIEYSIIHNTWLAPTYDSLLFLFSDLLPIFAQLLSLVFGLIRKKAGDGIPRVRITEADPLSDTSSIVDRNSFNSSFFDPPVEDLEIVKNSRFNHSSIKIEVSTKKNNKSKKHKK